MEIIKTTITNSVNDQVYTQYHVADSDEQAKSIIADEQARVDDWNSPGPGKMSIRWMDYEITNIEHCTLNDIIGLPLTTVVQIFNTISK